MKRMWPEGLKDLIVTQSVPIEGLEGKFETKVLILQQDEDENFTPIELFSSRDSIHQLDLVDWDGDGIDDLFYTTFPQNFWENGAVYWRKGEGRAFRFADWERRLLELDGTGLFGPPVDFDNDGDLDLQLYLTWLPTPGKSLWGVTGPNHTIGDLQFAERSQPRSIREFFPNGRTGLFDFDDDGDLDVLYSAFTYRIIGYQRLEWFENKGEAGYEPRLTGDGAPTPPGNLIDSVRLAERNSFVMADLNGDGTKDLIVGSFPPMARLEWFEIEKAAQPAAYETWAIDSTITGHSAAPEADWDGDTLSNWEEFAFGSNPAAIDQDHSGRPHIQNDSSGVSLVFQRRTDFENLGLSYRPLMSENLKSWLPWEEVSPRVSPFNDDYEIVTFPVPSLLDRAFFKVIPPSLERE